jgi:hypothetical protein
MKTPRLAIPLAVLGVIATSLVLAACGGSSSPSSTSSAAEEHQAEVKNADFAKCLREHGIEATASTGPGGEGHGIKIGGAGGPAKMEAAQKACARYQPEPRKINLSPQQKVEQEEAVQKFAKCMREHGIKVEASTQGGGVQIRIHARAGAEGAPNPESPGFQQAQSTCQKLLPKPPGGGPGPGGLSGASSVRGPSGSASGGESESSSSAGG